MESHLQRAITGTVAAVLIFGGWLWMTAIESEEELREPEYTVPERFLNEHKQGPVVDVDEIDTTQIQEPEQTQGWIYPPEQVRKTAGRVKQKIKRTVKK